MMLTDELKPCHLEKQVMSCIFTYDEDLHYWECSECEGTLFFSPDSPDSPKDNGYRYCPFCGRKIIKEVRNYE